MRPKCKLPLRRRQRYRCWSETCTRLQGTGGEVLAYSTLEVAEAGRRYLISQSNICSKYPPESRIERDVTFAKRPYDFPLQ